MKIIVCLGNPGNQYKKNRHNAGFIIGGHLKKEYSIQANKKNFSSYYGLGRIEGIEVLLLFPDTFMNKSGIAVQAVLQYYKEGPDNLFVIHDDIELPFGEYRTKFGGGHKGQNGIRSIMQEIGTPDFHRLRIGVGRPDDTGKSVADHVLSNFTKEEIQIIKNLYPESKEKLIGLFA